jgi:hypothetical protein
LYDKAQGTGQGINTSPSTCRGIHVDLTTGLCRHTPLYSCNLFHFSVFEERTLQKRVDDGPLSPSMGPSRSFWGRTLSHTPSHLGSSGDERCYLAMGSNAERPVLRVLRCMGRNRTHFFHSRKNSLTHMPARRGYHP